MTSTPIKMALVILALAGAVRGQTVEPRLAARIDRVLSRTPLIDGHNDLAWELRLRFAGKLAGGNILRVMRDVASVSRALRASSQASSATIGELDGVK